LRTKGKEWPHPTKPSGNNAGKEKGIAASNQTKWQQVPAKGSPRISAILHGILAAAALLS
jgi:hypothetical protein